MSGEVSGLLAQCSVPQSRREQKVWFGALSPSVVCSGGLSWAVVLVLVLILLFVALWFILRGDLF